MSIINYNLIKDFFTNNTKKKKDVNQKEYIEHTPVKYRWTHGATDLHLGDGLIIYTLIQYMRAKTCVCLGSGGGFIPRIMSQARIDLHDQEIFEGNKSMEWGDCGTTILVDASNGVGGNKHCDAYVQWEMLHRAHLFTIDEIPLDHFLDVIGRDPLWYNTFLNNIKVRLTNKTPMI